MKTSKKILTSVSIVLFLAFTSGLHAQDFVKTTSKVTTKVLIDNDQVRVIQLESPVGEATALHSHPAYLIYPLTDGKMEETVSGKPVSIIEFKAGEPKYMPAVTHIAKNVGTKPMKMILVELKTAPTASVK
jgi:quercetin dioxygenase-like cupin family protein